MWPRIVNLRRGIAVVALLLTLIIIVGKATWAQDTSGDASTATLTPTDAPTATLVPTDTPLPTQAPTDTPVPTDTPMPTNTPLPTATDTPLPTATLVPTTTPVLLTAPITDPALTVTQTEPAQIMSGQNGTLSVMGTNFTASTTVRLVGFGFLNVTFVNSSALTAALPSSLPAGQYGIEVSDPGNGTASAPGTLTVNAAPSTAAPAATATQVATAIPGQPRLVVNNFSASPSSIYPGGTTQITIQVFNVGSRTAEGVVVSLGDSKFAPANGQASVALPDIPAMTSYNAVLAVTAPLDASEGTQSIALVLSSRDFSGQTYSNNASVSVNVLAKPTSNAQVVLDSYVVEPSSATPGDSVTVRALFKNTGTDSADQVLIQLDGSNSVLLAGPDGNSFAVGDMPAGAGAAVVMKLVVASSAQSGAQSQSFTISYLQDGSAKQGSASISLSVETVTTPSPLLLLQSYSSGQDDPLQPGQQFSLALTLQNAGQVDVSDLLVTFGTVATSSSSASGTSATQSSPSTTTTTSSADFAIFGSGGTVLLGDLAAGQTVSLTQAFLVSTDLTSGIHDLPITLQYQTADGTSAQKSLDASVLVVVPPRVRITNTTTLADPLTAGTEATLSLKIANLGSAEVALTDMRVAADDNTDLGSDAETPLDPLQSDDDTTESITFTPKAAGTYTITVDVDYVDDLNQTQTITQTFTGTVSEAATQQAPSPFRGFQGPPQQAQDQNLLGRLLLGFLGLGG